MTVQVIVIVPEEIAGILHERGTVTAEAKELLKMVKEVGILLEPMHPGSKDPLLASFFIAVVQDLSAAEKAIAHLLKSPHIEAVYLKPQDELP